MKPITELVRNLSKQHRDLVDKNKKIAENMIRAAEAAKKAAPKK
jgi:hypothetical protein